MFVTRTWFGSSGTVWKALKGAQSSDITLLSCSKSYYFHQLYLRGTRTRVSYQMPFRLINMFSFMPDKLPYIYELNMVPFTFIT